MNHYELFYAIGNISEKKIEEAMEYHGKKVWYKPVFKYGCVAAVSVALVCGVFYIGQNWYQNFVLTPNLTVGSQEKTESTIAAPAEYSILSYDNNTYYYTGHPVESDQIEQYLGIGEVINATNNSQAMECRVYSTITDADNGSHGLAVLFGNTYYLYSVE